MELIVQPTKWAFTNIWTMTYVAWRDPWSLLYGLSLLWSGSYLWRYLFMPTTSIVWMLQLLLFTWLISCPNGVPKRTWNTVKIKENVEDLHKWSKIYVYNGVVLHHRYMNSLLWSSKIKKSWEKISKLQTFTIIHNMLTYTIHIEGTHQLTTPSRDNLVDQPGQLFRENELLYPYIRLLGRTNFSAPLWEEEGRNKEDSTFTLRGFVKEREVKEDRKRIRIIKTQDLW